MHDAETFTSVYSRRAVRHSRIWCKSLSNVFMDHKIGFLCTQPFTTPAFSKEVSHLGCKYSHSSHNPLLMFRKVCIVCPVCSYLFQPPRKKMILFFCYLLFIQLIICENCGWQQLSRISCQYVHCRNITLEKEIFPAATDSRFIRAVSMRGKKGI